MSPVDDTNLKHTLKTGMMFNEKCERELTAEPIIGCEKHVLFIFVANLG